MCHKLNSTWMIREQEQDLVAKGGLVAKGDSKSTRAHLDLLHSAPLALALSGTHPPSGSRDKDQLQEGDLRAPELTLTSFMVGP